MPSHSHDSGRRGSFAAARASRAVVSVLCASAALASAAAMASGDVARWKADGFQVTVDSQWSESGGYRPVQVSILPLKPPADEVRISVEFTTESSYRYSPRSSGGVTVEQDIMIPPGAKQAVTASVSVPQAASMQGYSLRFWEDGEPLTTLSRLASNHSFNNSALNFGESPDQFINALIIDSSASRASGNNAGFGSGFARSNSNTISGQSLRSHAVAIGEAPQRWLDYTALDIVCVSADELKTMARSDPRRWQALRHWTLSGGNLWIYAADGSWAGLPELENLLGLAAKNQRDGDDPLQRGWRRPGGAAGGVQTPAEILNLLPNAIRRRFTQSTTRDTALRRELGFGEVLVGAIPSSLASQNSWWMKLAGETDKRRLSWYQRNGLSATRENTDFWNLLIPGVGRVPLLEFQTLITIFVLGIGPVNYFLLRRRRKLHLLIVTVPAIALAVTLFLFGYAILSDGLGVRVRARTYTQIDQAGDEAVCWSRLSYYAGLAPSQGLSFSTDVAIFPLEPNLGDDANDTWRTLAWDDRQKLKSGWLPSRTRTQFLTQRVRRTPFELAIDESKPAQPPTVTNRLGAAVRRLLLCDGQGKLYFLRDLPAGGAEKLKSGDPTVIQREMSALFRENTPQAPANLSVGNTRRRRSWVATRANASLSAPSQSTSHLEVALEAALARLGGGRARLAPRSYMAIVERSPEVEYGIDHLSEEACFHVVEGRW